MVDVAMADENKVSAGRRSWGDAHVKDGAKFGAENRRIDAAKGDAAQGEVTRSDSGNHELKLDLFGTGQKGTARAWTTDFISSEV